MSIKKLSLALFAALVAFAVYAGGTSSLVLSFGPTGAAPPAGLINLTNHTIGINSGAVVRFSLDNDFSGSCGGGLGLAEGVVGGVATAYNDEWILNWQDCTFIDCASYEVRWRTISGTLSSPPTDVLGTPLPEETWSFSEWASGYVICDGTGWNGGLFLGPVWTQLGAAADAVIEVDIQKIDLTDGPVTGQITFTP